LLPFVPRPIHATGLEVRLAEGQSMEAFDGLSAMPSGHTSFFVGLAAGIFLVHRQWGIFLLFYTAFFISLPRIVMGYHWPADILAGALLGLVTVLVFFKPLRAATVRMNIVPYFEKHEALGYALLFLATFEVARMLHLTRSIVDFLLA
jgi:undecaprenyl-diphosphatase